MPATKVTIETRADGAGSLITARSLVPAQTLVVYSIERDASDVFVGNTAATWSLTNKTGSVVNGDLVAAGDNKSATFTANANGTATIHAVDGSFTATTGILSVIDALIPLADVKQYLLGNSPSSANDAMLVNWLVFITAKLEAELNQPVVARPTEDILNGSGGSVQYLRSGRIISLVGSDAAARLANLQFRDDSASSWQNLVTAESAISIDDENLLKIELLDGTVFPWGRKNIRVYYNCGFTGTPLTDIQKLALENIQMMFNESKAGGDLLGKVSRNIGEGGMTQNLSLKDLDSRWDAVINRWKRYGYEL